MVIYMSNTATTTNEVRLAGAFFKGSIHLATDSRFPASACNGRSTEGSWDGDAAEVTCKRCLKNMSEA